MAIRVLVGTTVRVQPHVFEASVKAIKAQRLPKGAVLDLVYIIDDLERQTELEKILEAADGTWIEGYDREAAVEYDSEDQSITHLWNEAAFDHVGKNKDLLIEYAISEGYTHIWFVDSDLVCSPDTLWSLLRADKDLISGVFWTFWNKGDHASLGPNVWLQHPYGQSGLGLHQSEFWHRLATRRLTMIAGGGACILIRTDALANGGPRYFPRLEHLPDHGMYRGEDRSFAIKAKQCHLNQAADPWPDIFHLYHPEDRHPDSVKAVSEFIQAMDDNHPPAYGDLVNLTLISLEDPGLADRPLTVRGRLGQLNLVPELEDAVTEMVPGNRRIVEVFFPPYWSIYPNSRRMIQVELVSTKPYGFAPVLSDVAFRGLLKDGK